MILADIPCEVRQILIRLAGDKKTAIFKEIRTRFPRWLPAPGVVASQFVDEKRDPACRSLDEAKPKERKHFGNLIQHKIAESVQWRETRMGPLPVSFQVEHRGHRRCPGAGVNTDRQINVHCRLVYREEIGIVQSVVAFDAAKENTDGAVRLRALDFLH